MLPAALAAGVALPTRAQEAAGDAEARGEQAAVESNAVYRYPAWLRSYETD